MSDLIKVEQESKSIFELGPRAMVDKASTMATVLNDVIEKQKLYSMIGKSKHVRVEGWQTIGTMLGILPRETKVIEHEDGSFEAHVELIAQATGNVVGGGSGYVGADERSWMDKPKFARRSMAITRATGKAYRLSFSWIMQLAGYDVTPLEEMQGVKEFKPEPKKKSAPKQETPTSTQEIIYTGAPDQRPMMVGVFDALRVDDNAAKKKLNEAVIAMKVPFTKDALMDAVETAYHKSSDEIQIPF